MVAVANGSTLLKIKVYTLATNTPELIEDVGEYAVKQLAYTPKYFLKSIREQTRNKLSMAHHSASIE